jgi:tetratricopeptide (TPR) repeat protein
MRPNKISQVFLAAAIAIVGGCHKDLKTSSDPVAQALRRLVAAPRDPSAYLELVKLSLERQDYLRAAQYMTLAEQSPLAQQQPELLFRLGLTISVRSHNYSGAIRRCQEQLQQHETLPIRRLLAALFEVRGDLREAERQHLLIHQIYPTAFAQLTEAARFYERSDLPDRLTRARALYERYLTASPEGIESVQVRAALLINRHDAKSPSPEVNRQ